MFLFVLCQKDFFAKKEKGQLPGFKPGPDIPRVEFALADKLQSVQPQYPTAKGLQRIR